MPLTIPIIDLILLAARQDFNGLIIGMPPPTAASNIKSTLFSAASSNNSLPYLAKTSLFAVTTFFLCFNASAINSLAGCSLPINSTTISISGSSRISSSLFVTIYFPPNWEARAGLLSRILVILTGTPTFFSISSAFFSKTISTPPPTVPAPNSPTLIASFIFGLPPLFKL
ncbi:hypothetical protein SDC9_91116 [bioreactor metagenome]|uniref:Uncharacterized protein n=1 Tax=bioreactor metagenome TaxID=1076179 RepID=A0A644ZVI2_9ZZZZ